MTINREYKVFADIKPRPESHELSAVNILASRLKQDIYFITPENCKTPDFEMGGVTWEMKSPTGSGKNTIQHQLTRASKQSANIVLDLRRIKMNEDKAIRAAKYSFKRIITIKKMIIINKKGEIIEITK